MSKEQTSTVVCPLICRLLADPMDGVKQKVAEVEVTGAAFTEK